MTWIWIFFIVFVCICLALDLFVLNKEDHVISAKEAGKWTSLWVSIALLFSIVVWWLFSEEWVMNPTGLTPGEAVLDYVTGYLVELSLSVDNIFVIAVSLVLFKFPLFIRSGFFSWGFLAQLFS